MLLGMSQKSELFSPLMDGRFAKDYKMTIGVDLYTKMVETEKFKVTLKIWDKSTRERYKFFRKSFYRNGAAAIIIEDDEEKINAWKEKVIKYALKGAESVVLAPNDSVEGVLKELTRKLIKNKYNK